MCERARPAGRPTLAAILAALAMAGGAPGPAGGQVTEAALVDSIDALLPRIRAIRAERTAARERAAAAAARRTPPAFLDTVSAGPLTVVAIRDQAPDGARLVAAAWESLPPFTSGTPLLDSTAIVFYRGNEELGVPVGYRHRVRLELDGGTTGDAARERARRALQQGIVDALPGSLARWLRRHPLVHDMSGGAIARALLFSHSRAGRECALGDRDACWSALGLTGAVDPVGAAYSRADRAVLSARGDGAWGDLARCEEDDGPFCDIAAGRWERLLPAHPGIRAHFLATALEEGGPGSLDRLVASGWAHEPPPARPETSDLVILRSYYESDEYAEWRARRPDHATRFGPLLRERLAVATGRDPDALMDVWMAGFARPEARERHDDGSRSRTLLWIVLFSVLATGSTRWRLG